MNTPSHNVVGWFEMPVTDMGRAIKFYETVFDIKLEHRPSDELDMAWFPWVPNTPGAAGALVKHPDWYKPSLDGPLIYFTAFSGDVDVELGRVEAAGGKIAVPKKSIGEYGFMACAIDTEGNRFAIHANPNNKS